MAETKITQLTISPYIDGTEYLIVDNTEVTRRTTINSLSSVVQAWAIPSNTVLQSNSATWNNTSSTVQAYSATWSQGTSAGNVAVNTVVQSNSATWNNTSSTVQAYSATWSQGSSAVNAIVQSTSATWNNTASTVQSNSATWSQGSSAVNTVVQSNSATWSQGSSAVNTVVQTYSATWSQSNSATYFDTIPTSTSFTISADNRNKMIVYTNTSAITAYITTNINVAGFNTTIAQLSTGTVTIALSNNYSAGIISYGNLYTTAGQGAVVSLIRASDNIFLISGLLQ